MPSSQKGSQHDALRLHHRVISSSFGGLVTAMLMTPLDVLKIRMQTFKLFAEASCHNYYTIPMDYLCTCVPIDNETKSWYRKSLQLLDTSFNARPTSDCVYHAGHPSVQDYVRGYLRLSTTFTNILRNESYVALFRGLSPAVAMALPQTVIYYTINDWLKERYGYFTAPTDGGNEQSYLSSAARDWSPGMFGGVSRVIAVAVISPIELLRTKMQAIPKSQGRLKLTLLYMLKEGGVRSLWTGMSPTLLRDVPYSIIFWNLFDRLKSSYFRQYVPYDCENPDFRSLSFVPAFVFGSCAGFTSGLLTHPFDVVKTNRQVRLGEPYFKDKPHPKSTLLAIQNLYHFDGLRALYVGLTPRIVKNTVASALMIGIFESLKKNFADSGR